MNPLFIPSVVCLSSLVVVFGAGLPGTTTGYWDCCKASCAWNGKAQVSHPVQSCAKDGVTPVSVDGQSVCGNGPSHMCSNQQPFVINSSLSFGFAAAKLANQGESDWCCACHEITFTNTNVAGMKMVVQITNTGGDLGANHFDLEIPGAGVGYLNGCKAQWGAPDDGWGRRYGGVIAEHECDALPKALQPGCHWRFGWWKDAPIPKITFRRVACPKSVTDRTKCIRNDEHSVADKSYAPLSVKY